MNNRIKNEMYQALPHIFIASKFKGQKYRKWGEPGNEAIVPVYPDINFEK